MNTLYYSYYRKYILIGSVCIYTLSIFQAYCQSGILDKVRNIEALNDSERNKLVLSAISEFDMLEWELRNKLLTGDHDVKCYAACMIGNYRMLSPETLAALAKNIAVLDLNRPNLTQQWHWEDVPVYGALLNIGMPVIPYMIKNIEQSDDALIIKLSLRVIMRLSGEKAGQEQLESALKMQTNMTIKQRLEKAIKYTESKEYKDLKNEITDATWKPAIEATKKRK